MTVERNEADDGSSQESLGRARAAAQAIYDDPEAPVGYEPQGAAECREAVTALAERFAAAGGTVAQILVNARAAARILSDDHLQGVSEIVQNADDSGATTVRFYQTADALIAIHDGSPLTLRDVHALAAPWLTTKSEEALATGRFGIGLLTLHMLAPAFEIHSSCYHLKLGEPTLEAVAAIRLPEEMAAPSETVLRVPLTPGTLQHDELLQWCASWDDSSLLFLRSVCQVAFYAGENGRQLMLAPGPARDVDLDVADTNLVVGQRVLGAPDGRRWSVYQADVTSPPGLQRAHKKTDPTTPIAVALPLGAAASTGRLYAGLPVATTFLGLFANAQFDPVASRQRFADTQWNAALAALVAELWAAAVLDLFLEMPNVGWQVIPEPLSQDSDESITDVRSGFVQQIEKLITDLSDQIVSAALKLPTEGALVPINQLAVEDEPLEGLLTAAEIADLARLPHTLPTSCRDEHGRWRKILDHWRAIGVNLPTPISVTQALPLAEEEARSAPSTIALVAAALNAGLEKLLVRLQCFVLADGTRASPPDAHDLRVFAGDGIGLAATLDIAQSLHPDYFAKASEAAKTVLTWLREYNSMVDATDDRAVLERIAAAGTHGTSTQAALSDDQIVALRDALERLSHEDWERLGPPIGRAIKMSAFRHDNRGKRTELAASPAMAYQPKTIDRDPDSFAFAADTAPGLVWLAPRYARVLQSSLGRAGLGAQRFVRLLGAQTSPRLMLHPRLYRRFSDSRKGLSAHLPDAPTARTQALRDLNATYTLDDRYSPDLQAVLHHIAKDRRALRRRERAVAIIAVLGRDWPTLTEHAEVPAADDYRSWQIRGPTRAWWLWQAGSVPWLDNAEAAPRPPVNLRVRTAATLAVYGTNAALFLHPAFSGSRPDVLAALGVAGEPDSRQIVTRLQQLRDNPPDGTNLAAETAVIYQALAARLSRGSRTSGGLTAARLRQLFGGGAGLIYTSGGWRPPGEVLRGEPVFGRYKTFAPRIPGTEALWIALQVRTPDLDDCLAVMSAMSKQADPDSDSKTIMLETLRLMTSLITSNAPAERQAQRLRQLPLWTTQGWVSRRPIYAVDDPSLAAGIDDRLPVWQPGGELAQFSDLLTSLRLHMVGEDSTQVVDHEAGYADDELTELFLDSVDLLREDLARNDPGAEGSVRIGWDLLSHFTVYVRPGLSVRIKGLPDAPLTVNVRAKIERSRAALYVIDTDSLARVDGGGRAVAGLFSTDRRRLSQAWLAAVEAAREGRRAERLQLAAERAAEEEAAAQDAIAAKLAQVQAQAKQRQTNKSKGGVSASYRGATRSGSADEQAGARAGPAGSPPYGEPPKPRVLVDPSTLVVVDPDGTIVQGTGGTRNRREPKPGKPPRLRDPQTAGVPPIQRSAPRSYTELEKETLGLQLVMRVLGSDARDMIDLRAQRGVGADAIDELRQYYELKVSAGPEPDEITLEDAQIRRAMSTSDFFLAVVSGLEGPNATPKVRIIVNPLGQLRMSEKSVIKFSGVRQSYSLVYQLKPEAEP